MKVLKFRVARPTDDLVAVRGFYVDGLGLLDRGGFVNHAGYDGLLVSTDDDSYELEFTRHVDGSPCPSPSKDNLLVFTFENATEIDAIAARLGERGHVAVSPQNPYWLGKGLTFEDPDGWRVVLFDRSKRSSD